MKLGTQQFPTPAGTADTVVGVAASQCSATNISVSLPKRDFLSLNWSEKEGRQAGTAAGQL